MSKDFEKILGKVSEDIAEALKEAYIDGFNAGSAYDKPTPAQFNAAHDEPIGYGEDGEIYVVRGDISISKALHKIKTLFDKEGYDYKDIQEISDHVRIASIAYVPEDISGTPGYYYRNDGSGVYTAWVWRA